MLMSKKPLKICGMELTMRKPVLKSILIFETQKMPEIDPKYL
jgi:hypothetical protein